MYKIDAQNQLAHIDHVYSTSPNIQLSAENVAFTLETIDQLPDTVPTVIYAHLPYLECYMHPFAADSPNDKQFFFQPGRKFGTEPDRKVKLTKGEDYDSEEIGQGSLTLGKVVFADARMLNEVPRRKPEGPIPTRAGGVTPARGGGITLHDGAAPNDWTDVVVST